MNGDGLHPFVTYRQIFFAFCIESVRIPPLHRRRVERQRRHGIDDRHHRSRGASGIERFQEAAADVAGVDAVVGVAQAGGERCDARAIGVCAERTGERLELPAQCAAAADQVPVR